MRLSDFRWYRKLKGGIWFKVNRNPYGDKPDIIWLNNVDIPVAYLILEIEMP